MASMTFHESYGDVSVAQLRAYKKYNVSQTDHDTLVYLLGEDNREAIVKAVTNPDLHSGKSFSSYRFIQSMGG